MSPPSSPRRKYSVEVVGPAVPWQAVRATPPGVRLSPGPAVSRTRPSPSYFVHALWPLASVTCKTRLVLQSLTVVAACPRAFEMLTVVVGDCEHRKKSLVVVVGLPLGSIVRSTSPVSKYWAWLSTALGSVSRSELTVVTFPRAFGAGSRLGAPLATSGKAPYSS